MEQPLKKAKPGSEKKPEPQKVIINMHNAWTEEDKKRNPERWAEIEKGIADDVAKQKKNIKADNDDNEKKSSPQDLSKEMKRSQKESVAKADAKEENVSKKKSGPEVKVIKKIIVEKKNKESEKKISEKAPAEKPVEVKKAETVPTPEKNERKVEEKNVSPEVPETLAKKTEQLEAELKDAREKYAKTHYGASSKISRIKRMLPLIKTDVGDMEEVNSSYQEYKQTMLKLIDSQLADLKERKDLSPEEMKKEMGDLVKRYNLGEKISLFEARTNARAEARKGEISERLLNVSAKAINGYRKLNWKYKLAISAGLLVTAGGLGAIGAGTAAGMAILAKRGFSSAVLGTGVTTGLEAMYRRGEGKRSEKAEKEALESIEEKDKDVLKFVELQKILNDQVEVCNKALSKELKSARNRKLIGAGIAVSAFILPSAMKYFAGGAEQVAESSGAAKGIIKEIPKEDVIKESVEKKIVSAAELTVAKGSSIEGTLIKQLMSEGISKEEAGRMAHRMAVDYAKEKNLEKGMYSLVQPGTQIEYDKATHKILNVGSKDKMGWFAEKPETGTPSGALTKEMPGPETHVEVFADNQLGWDNMSKAMHKELAGVYGSKVDELHGQYEKYLQANSLVRSMQEELQNQVLEGDKRETIELEIKYWQKIADSSLREFNAKSGILKKMWEGIIQGSDYKISEFREMKAKDFFFSEGVKPLDQTSKAFQKIRTLVNYLGIKIGDKTMDQLAIEINQKMIEKGFPKLPKVSK